MALFRYSLAWRNPHVPCPGPQTLLVVEADTSRIPAAILCLWKPGNGYAVCVQPLGSITGRRRWSREAKARVRKSNLRRRLSKKVPLFAEVFYEAELAARPAYFNAEDKPT